METAVESVEGLVLKTRETSSMARGPSLRFFFFGGAAAGGQGGSS